MADDLIARARRALSRLDTGLPPWPLVRDLADEVQRARSFKSLPPGMVWQDYYSPDDVLKVMAERDNELDRLRALQRDDQDTAKRAIAERDAALAEVGWRTEWSNELATKYVPEEFDDDADLETIIGNWAEFASGELNRLRAAIARVEALAGDWSDFVPMWALREALTGEPGDRQ